jgi:hypothetical protein
MKGPDTEPGAVEHLALENAESEAQQDIEARGLDPIDVVIAEAIHEPRPQRINDKYIRG